MAQLKAIILVLVLFFSVPLVAAPKFYFGTVNYQEQLTNLPSWKEALEASDGMLLHLHFWVRKMSTAPTKTVSNADAIIRGIHLL